MMCESPYGYDGIDPSPPDPVIVRTMLNNAAQGIRSHPIVLLHHPWWMRAPLLVPRRIRAVLKQWIPREYIRRFEAGMMRWGCHAYLFPVIRAAYPATTINDAVTITPFRPLTPPADLWAAPVPRKVNGPSPFAPGRSDMQPPRG
jgi:hypothetical protein